MRSIIVITSTRAEYYKLEPIINYLHYSDIFELYLIVCGSHLIHDHGNTVDLINYPIYAKVNTYVYGSNNKIMAESCGLAMTKFPQLFDDINPEAVIIHGDRFDVVSVAVACSLMNIGIIHVEGGELTGTIDEHLRHAITKLAHYHLVSNESSRNRLIQMGEDENRVFVVGCPSYDKMLNLTRNKNNLDNVGGYQFSVNVNEYIIAMYHPVTTNIENSVEEYRHFLTALVETGKRVILFYPNVDNGSKQLIKLINQMGVRNKDNFVVLKSLPFETYVTLLSYSSCIVGNSSSGIREACIFGIPSITIGTRQNRRDISENVTCLDTVDSSQQLTDILNKEYGKRYEPTYLYGKGDSMKRIAEIFENNVMRFEEKQFKDISLN